MLSSIHQQLRPVRSRLTLRRVATALAGALVLGGWVGLVAGILTVFGGGVIAAVVGMAVLILFPLLAIAAVYLLRRVSWQQAARAVDRHFQLHNRAGTALYLAEHPSGDPLDAVQADDALSRLRQLNAREAVSLDIPWQRLLGGLALCLFAAGLIAWGLAAPPTTSAAANATAMDEIVDKAAPRTTVDATPLSPKLVEQSVRHGAALGNDGQSGFRSAVDRDAVDRYFDAWPAGNSP